MPPVDPGTPRPEDADVENDAALDQRVDVATATLNDSQIVRALADLSILSETLQADSQAEVHLSAPVREVLQAAELPHATPRTAAGAARLRRSLARSSAAQRALTSPAPAPGAATPLPAAAAAAAETQVAQLQTALDTVKHALATGSYLPDASLLGLGPRASSRYDRDQEDQFRKALKSLPRICSSDPRLAERIDAMYERLVTWHLDQAAKGLDVAWVTMVMYILDVMFQLTAPADATTPHTSSQRLYRWWIGSVSAAKPNPVVIAGRRYFLGADNGYKHKTIRNKWVEAGRNYEVLDWETIFQEICTDARAKYGSSVEALVHAVYAIKFQDPEQNLLKETPVEFCERVQFKKEDALAIALRQNRSAHQAGIPEPLAMRTMVLRQLGCEDGNTRPFMPTTIQDIIRRIDDANVNGEFTFEDVIQAVSAAYNQVLSRLNDYMGFVQQGRQLMSSGMLTDDTLSRVTTAETHRLLASHPDTKNFLSLGAPGPAGQPSKAGPSKATTLATTTEATPPAAAPSDRCPGCNKKGHSVERCWYMHPDQSPKGLAYLKHDVAGLGADSYINAFRRYVYEAFENGKQPMMWVEWFPLHKAAQAAQPDARAMYTQVPPPATDAHLCTYPVIIEDPTPAVNLDPMPLLGSGVFPTATNLFTAAVTVPDQGSSMMSYLMRQLCGVCWPAPDASSVEAATPALDNELEWATPAVDLRIPVLPPVEGHSEPREPAAFFHDRLVADGFLEQGDWHDYFEPAAREEFPSYLMVAPHQDIEWHGRPWQGRGPRLCLAPLDARFTAPMAARRSLAGRLAHHRRVIPGQSRLAGAALAGMPLGLNIAPATAFYTPEAVFVGAQTARTGRLPRGWVPRHYSVASPPRRTLPETPGLPTGLPAAAAVFAPSAPIMEEVDLPFAQPPAAPQQPEAAIVEQQEALVQPDPHTLRTVELHSRTQAVNEPDVAAMSQLGLHCAVDTLASINRLVQVVAAPGFKSTAQSSAIAAEASQAWQTLARDNDISGFELLVQGVTIPSTELSRNLHDRHERASQALAEAFSSDRAVLMHSLPASVATPGIHLLIHRAKGPSATVQWPFAVDTCSDVNLIHAAMVKALQIPFCPTNRRLQGSTAGSVALPGELPSGVLSIGLALGDPAQAVMIELPWLITTADVHRETPLLGSLALARLGAVIHSDPDQQWGRLQYRIYDKTAASFAIGTIPLFTRPLLRPPLATGQAGDA